MQVVGSNVTLTCTVELHSAVLVSEIFFLVVDAQLSRDGSPLPTGLQTVTHTTYTYTTQLNSFGRSNFGSYMCTAIVRPAPSRFIYLTGTETLSDTVNLTASKYFIEL